MASIVKKMKKLRLKWFTHVKRRSVDALVRRRERLAMVGIKRGRDNLKKYWWEVIRQDKVHLGFTGNMTLDRRV